MRDPEFIVLRNRFLLGIFISILFIIPIIFIINNKILVKEDSIIKKIDNQESIVLLVTDNDCDKCKDYSNLLDDKNVEYSIVNVDKDRIHSKILDKLEITSNEIIPPTLVYIKGGVFYASLVDIKDEKELTSFIKNHELIKE